MANDRGRTVSADTARRLLAAVGRQVEYGVNAWIPAGGLRLGLDRVDAIDVVAQCEHHHTRLGSVYKVHRPLDGSLYRLAESGALTVLGPVRADRIICRLPGTSVPLRIWTCNADTLPVVLLDRTGPPAFLRACRRWRWRGGLLPDGLLMDRSYVWTVSDPADTFTAGFGARLFRDGLWRRRLRFRDEAELTQYLYGREIPPAERLAYARSKQ